jgi:hypothetical protein
MECESVLANLEGKFVGAHIRRVIAREDHGFNSREYKKYQDMCDELGRKIDELRLQELELKNDNNQTEQNDEQKLEAVVREIVQQRFKMIHEAEKIKLPEIFCQRFVNGAVEGVLNRIRNLDHSYTLRTERLLHELRQSGKLLY